MNFVKGLLGWNKKAAGEEEDLTSFQAQCRMYKILVKKEVCELKYAVISFEDAKDKPFSYNIVITNDKERDPSKGGEQFKFQVTDNMHLKSAYYEKDSKETLTFEWELQKHVAIKVEFSTEINGNLSSGLDFKVRLCQLIYETTHQKSVKNASKESDYLCYCNDVVAPLQHGVLSPEGYEQSRSQKINEQIKKSQELEAEKPEIIPQTGHAAPMDYSAPVLYPKFDSLQKSSPVKPVSQSEPLPKPQEEVKFVTPHPVQQPATQPVQQPTQTLPKAIVEEVKHQTSPQKLQSIEATAGVRTEKFPVKQGQKTSIKDIPAATADAAELAKRIQAGDEALLYAEGVTLVTIDPTGAVTQAHPNIVAAVKKGKDYKSSFILFDLEKTPVYSRYISSNLSYGYDNERNLFQWIDLEDDKQLALYSIKFPTRHQLNLFKYAVSRSLLESNRKEDFESIFKKEEAEWANRVMREEVDKKETDYLEKELPEADDLEYSEDVSSTAPYRDDEENHTFVQGKLCDRLFFPKKNHFSVYRAGDQSPTGFEYLTDLPAVKAFDGSLVKPKKVLMKEQDTKMLVLNDADDKKVYYVDVEKGKLIDEIYTDGLNTFGDVAPSSKEAEFTVDPTFLAINARSIFMCDPRQSTKEKAVKSKIYAKSNYFNCVSSNNDGNFAVASETGEVRLFKEVGQNAKNLFHGNGDPIYALDSTRDGKWLLATCKAHLLLIPTFTEEKGSGFKTSLGAEKPIPRVLKIKPQDMSRYGIGTVDFTAAKFDDDNKSQECYIVSSTGPFLITWNMKKVLQDAPKKYEIKKMSDRVVCNEFRYTKKASDEKQLLVALPKSVHVQKARKVGSK